MKHPLTGKPLPELKRIRFPFELDDHSRRRYAHEESLRRHRLFWDCLNAVEGVDPFAPIQHPTGDLPPSPLDSSGGDGEPA